ncbi:hypothetical protein L6232_22015, partial [Shewanella sp. C31]|nr:hypothetical protein [Shewanella electrica]
VDHKNFYHLSDYNVLAFHDDDSIASMPQGFDSDDLNSRVLKAQGCSLVVHVLMNSTALKAQLGCCSSAARSSTAWKAQQ